MGSKNNYWPLVPLMGQRVLTCLCGSDVAVGHLHGGLLVLHESSPWCDDFSTQHDDDTGLGVFEYLEKLGYNAATKGLVRT